MEQRKFDYKTIEDLKADIEKAGVNLPLSDNLEVLKKPVKIGDKVVPNSLGIHPMEGCDGTPDGAPSDLTFRRYKRFGAGGAGLLWMEACAVVKEGRANPLQISMNEGNIDKFKELVAETKKAAKESMGEDFEPYTVIQLTHSGRYSNPDYDKSPAIMATEENPYIDPYTKPIRRVITDEELEALEDKYVEAAKFAKEAGFDAVDIKACHRYLNSELLSAHTREGKYGGSFENRTRFLLNIIDKVKAEVDIDIAVRMNAYDAIPYPYGWGTDKDGKPDLTEPKKLIKILYEKGVKLVDISTGNPYYNPHVGRPCDIGPYRANEHQVESAARMLNIIKEMQAEVPNMVIMGTGFSWFREYGANLAAACVENGWMTIAGMGRQAFAYPDFAKDIIENGGMVRNKCCIACTKCTEIMRYHSKAGCVVRDSKVYVPIWKEATNGSTIMTDRVDIHI